MPFPRLMYVPFVSISLLTLLSTSLSGQQLVNRARQSVATTTQGTTEHVQAKLAETHALSRYDLKLAYECAEQTRQLATNLGDGASAAIALAAQARIAVNCMGPDAAKKAINEAREQLPADAPLNAAAEVAYASAIVNWTLDRPPECLAALREALDLAEQGNVARILIKSNILALGTVGWPDDPVKEAQRWRDIARNSRLVGLEFECRILEVVSKKRTGVHVATDAEYAALVAEAIKLGDRFAEIYLTQTRANNAASHDVQLAFDTLQPAVAAAESLGDREQISTTHEYSARLLLHMGQHDDAVREIKAAIAAVRGMGMIDRELMVTQSASHIASRLGNGKDVETYSNRIGELNQVLANRSTQDQRARLWRDSTKLRRDLRNQRDDHAAAMAEMSTRQNITLMVGGGTLCLLLAIASVMLLRSRRRLARANSELASALAASQSLQDERSALELSLRQIERLDSIGLLAGGFAHDFNNILVPIRGNAQLLSMDNQITGPQRELIDQILHASGRAAGLCSDILSYARAEPTPQEPIDMREVVKSITPLAQSGFGASIEVSMDLGNRVAPVHADRSQLEQVLLNVLVNAGDAIHISGHIHMSIDEQTLDGTPPSGYWFGEFDGKARECVAVSILDNGQGMNAETIRRIFDPFFTTRFAGRGLGLAASFSILRRHQGVVEVQSEVGKGTQFTIYLPKHTATSKTADEPTMVLQPHATAITTEPPIGGATILVVDDEPTVCEVVRGALEIDNHKVLVAHNGVDALELAEQYSDELDLALLDVTMPNMDGPSLAHHLQGKIPGIAVVMMTGHAESAVRTACLKLPLIQKPFDLPGLRSTIKEHLAIGV